MNDRGEMSFWDHLEVLRWSIFRILIALLIVLVGCFIVMPHIFDSFILGPTTSDFFIYRWFSRIAGQGSLAPDLSSDFHIDIININVASQFFTHMSTSFWMALLLIAPYIIYELWKFIKPALYDYEASSVRRMFCFATVLFYCGCVVGYCIVFPLTFRFLSLYSVGGSVVNQINLNSYMGMFISLVFIMGLAFELPTLAALLSRLGLIDKSFLRNYRRHAIVILLVLAALITPSGDPFTLTVVFLPLYLLYELSILVVRK